MNPDQIVTRACLLAATALVIILAFGGCGGGQATAEEIAQHDADVQAVALMTTHRPGEPKTMTIQPVNCSQGACK